MTGQSPGDLKKANKPIRRTALPPDEGHLLRKESTPCRLYVSAHGKGQTTHNLNLNLLNGIYVPSAGNAEKAGKP
jgi:hypothetical protein